MPRPDQTPRLPKLPFLVADAALLATAAYLAANSHHPLATTPLIAIASCVALAAILGAIPFLTDYARRQDEALDERQRALEALGATVTASAEQIGIAASGVHEIAELVQKNLRAADQLPHKLQEKIGEFTAQLTNARADETEELEKSLAELRAAESERLAAIAEKIAKAAADLAKLEAASQKHLAATTDALARLTASSGQHFSELATATAAAIARAQTAATTAIDDKLAAADLAFASTRTALLVELDARLADFRTAVTGPLPPQAAPPPAPPVTPPSSASTSENAAPLEAPSIPAPLPPPNASSPDSPSPSVAPAPAPRKRAPRKSPPPSESEWLPPAEPTLDLLDSAPVSLSETARPASPPAPPADDDFVQFSPDEIPAPAFQLKSAPLKAEPETPASKPDASADGATRLSVTAYIGIGNRLFIRGAGPGLSWEKGIPLQFISIGKWRWETNDATAPVTYKLYKNDAQECAALGEQVLIPAHQTEVTATF